MSHVDAAAIWNHLNQLTKPSGSLGQLEQLAARMCKVQGTVHPVSRPRRAVLFAADHGVVTEGVSAWPAEITRLMIENIRTGGAASSVLAKVTGTELRLVNVGVITGDSNAPISPRSASAPHVTYRNACIRPGSGNLYHEPAMSLDDFQQAILVGREEAQLAVNDGIRVAAVGEMGIGNTTPASCLTMLLAGVSLDEAVGRGAGADDDTLARKCKIVQAAVERVQQAGQVHRPESLASVAGLEIAAMAGFYAEASQRDLMVILDGYVATAAALLAETFEPHCTDSMIASHRSAEPGHRRALEALGLTPMLDWQLRLGEGTGALLLMPMLDAATAICSQMSCFTDLGFAAETQG